MSTATPTESKLATATPPLLTLRFFTMCGFTFTVFVSGFMLFPTAPFHILDLGGTKLTAGLFLGFLTYGSAFSAPFTGAFSDRVGKRKTILIASVTLAAISFYYGYAPNITTLLLLVPVHGVFWSATLTASAAYLVDLVPETRRAEGIAYWGLSTVAAIAIAPSVAFWIYDRGGWLALSLVAGSLNLVMATIALRLETQKSPVGESTSAHFVEWRVLALSLTLFLFSFGYGGITSFVALYAEASGTSAKGAYFTALAIVILFTRPVVGRFADRIGHKRVFVPCLVLAAVGLGLLVPGGTMGWLIASAVVFGLGFGSAFPVFTAYVMHHVDTTRRGAAFGSMLAAFDTGIGTGSMLLGLIVERMGYRAAFAFAASLAVLALPYFLFSDRRIFQTL